MEYTVIKEVKTTETLTRRVHIEPTVSGFILTMNGDMILCCDEGDGTAYVYQDFYTYFPTIEDRDQKMKKGGAQ